jgi:L-ribulose-5-phosphate 3-epimerase
MPNYSRRQVLAAAASAAAASAAPRQDEPSKPTLCLFSKHLPHLGYKEMATTLKQMGFPGVDLTTRPKGHVLPENAERDLPRVHEALAAEGVSIPMITTGLLSRNDPSARPLLYAAAKLGIPYFKIGYYKFKDVSKLDSYLTQVKADVESLAAIAQHAGITGGFHNHSGAYVGSSLWDHWWVLRDTDPAAAGFYYDPCHATIEGGKSGWEIGFHRVESKLKMVACKDFFWEKVGGKWEATMCPLGQGMVDYPKFFKMLSASGFTGPISLHVEYKIEAPTESQRIEKEMAAIERDYKYLKSQYQAVYGA